MEPKDISIVSHPDLEPIAKALSSIPFNFPKVQEVVARSLSASSLKKFDFGTIVGIYFEASIHAILEAIPSSKNMFLDPIPVGITTPNYYIDSGLKLREARVVKKPQTDLHITEYDRVLTVGSNPAVPVVIEAKLRPPERIVDYDDREKFKLNVLKNKLHPIAQVFNTSRISFLLVVPKYVASQYLIAQGIINTGISLAETVTEYAFFIDQLEKHAVLPRNWKQHTRRPRA